MEITIIGTGKMARGIATRLLAGGNQVTLVGHQPGDAEKLASELQEAASGEARVTPAKSGPTGDVVVLAVPYAAATPVVQQYRDQLAGKVIVDITNPVDFQTMDPALPADTSAAEEISDVAPEGASVVKAFNTTFAGTLETGEVAGEPLDVLIAGDDPQAKATLAELVESGGMRVVDAGPLKRARQLEALGLLHMAVQFTLDTNFGSAVKIVA